MTKHPPEAQQVNDILDGRVTVRWQTAEELDVRTVPGSAVYLRLTEDCQRGLVITQFCDGSITGSVTLSGACLHAAAAVCSELLEATR